MGFLFYGEHRQTDKENVSLPTPPPPLLFQSIPDHASSLLLTIYDNQNFKMFKFNFFFPLVNQNLTQPTSSALIFDASSDNLM